MSLRFEWDQAKADTNRRKHGITFEEGASVFADPFAITEFDQIARGEYRWQTIGRVERALLLVVIHTDRDDADVEVVRIISARRADKREKRRYGQDRDL